MKKNLVSGLIAAVLAAGSAGVVAGTASADTSPPLVNCAPQFAVGPVPWAIPSSVHPCLHFGQWWNRRQAGTNWERPQCNVEWWGALQYSCSNSWVSHANNGGTEDTTMHAQINTAPWMGGFHW